MFINADKNIIQELNLSMINNNGWSQEHCNAITTRDKAAEVLKKEQADLSICK